MVKILRNIWLFAILIALSTVSCSEEQTDSFFKKIIKAPPSHIERDVKGHDQIFAVHAILRMGIKGGTIGVGINGDEQVGVYNVYETLLDSTALPIRQEIDMSRDDDGEITITTQRDHFDVIASDKIYYGLELIYYDMNGKPINHQFSSYPFKKDKGGNIVPDEENSTLLYHQHFFGIGSTSLKLDKSVVKTNDVRQLHTSNPTLQLAFPRTLDKIPTYYPEYTFREENGEGVRATKFSMNNIFVPIENGFKPKEEKIPFIEDLAWESIKRSGKQESLNDFTYKGKKYWLYKSRDYFGLNKLVPEIFSYEYRDTDPVDKPLGYLYEEHSNDDFIDDTGNARDRFSNTVGFLHQKRGLLSSDPRDRLGFKGILQFHKSNMAFQLQVKICHILNKLQDGSGREIPAKYGNKESYANGGLWDFNQLQSGWDSFDIDYPISIRVIGDTRSDEAKFINDIMKFYPKVDKTYLHRLLSDPKSFSTAYKKDMLYM